MFILPDDLAGRDYNCSRLDTEARTSMIPNSGNGLFTTDDYQPVGMSSTRVIGHLFGKFMTKERYDDLINNPHSAIGRFEIDIVLETMRGSNYALDVSDVFSDGENDYYIIISPQCPMGLMNDASTWVTKSGEALAQKHQLSSLTFPKDYHYSKGKMQSTAFPITVSNVPMMKGTELYLNYNWHDSEWKAQRRRRALYQSLSFDPLPAIAHPRSAMQQRQWINVMLFMMLSSSQTAMKKFRYAMNVGAAPQRSKSRELKSVHIGPCSQAADPMGVYLKQRLKSDL